MRLGVFAHDRYISLWIMQLLRFPLLNFLEAYVLPEFIFLPLGLQDVCASMELTAVMVIPSETISSSGSWKFFPLELLY